MIKNVVFDFGQVLVRFDPDYMTGIYVSDPEDKALLASVIFDRLYWDKLDAGTISDSEVIEECCKRLPRRLHKLVSEIYYNWIYNLPEIPGMDRVVRTAKERCSGRIYLLSNISTYFAIHKDEIPILGHFDKCIFSAVCGKTKPDAEIFAHLCREYGILPEQTLFIDDSEKNIRGATDFGIEGYLFDGDADKLLAYLDEVLE